MRTKTFLAVSFVLAGLGWAADAQAYQFVRVVSGSEILVTREGRQLSLLVSGVSVPAPPTPGTTGEYRGAEAREFLEQVLKSQSAFIKELEPVRAGAKSVRVRIRVGPNGERDLAILLAEAGLALVDRPVGEDPEFLASVRDGERAARIARRGMHDGGYAAFMSGKGLVVDFGVGTLSGDKATGKSYRAYLTDLAEDRTGSASKEPYNGIHRSGVAAIRDWGEQMGLPRDSSVAGH